MNIERLYKILLKLDRSFEELQFGDTIGGGGGLGLDGGRSVVDSGSLTDSREPTDELGQEKKVLNCDECKEKFKEKEQKSYAKATEDCKKKADGCLANMGKCFCIEEPKIALEDGQELPGGFRLSCKSSSTCNGKGTYQVGNINKGPYKTKRECELHQGDTDVAFWQLEVKKCCDSIYGIGPKADGTMMPGNCMEIAEKQKGRHTNWYAKCWEKAKEVYNCDGGMSLSIPKVDYGEPDKPPSDTP